MQLTLFRDVVEERTQGVAPLSGSPAPIQARAVKSPTQIGASPILPTKPQWRPITDLECRAIRAISPLRYPVATAQKRFARRIQSAPARGEITDRQAHYVWLTVWRFRRQIDDWELVDLAGKIALPGYRC